MAEGGLSRSVAGSSDVIHDISCTPCSEDARNTEAVNYCVNCETYFCQTCVGYHNKVLKTHNVLDRNAMKSIKHESKQSEAEARDCSEHPGNVIQMYCGNHDVVCCTVCVAVDHRICKGVNFVPKLGKEILESVRGHTTEASLGETRRELLQYKSKKLNELYQLEKKKESILDAMVEMETRLIAKIHTLHETGKEDICSKTKDMSDKINNDIDSLNELLKRIEKRTKHFEHCPYGNEAQFFVFMKQSQMLESDCKTMLEVTKFDPVDHISYQPNDQIDALLGEMKSFGEIATSDLCPYSANLEDEYDVSVKDDKNPCTVYDICRVDNEFIISDHDNDKVKKLDKNFVVTKWCKTSGAWGLCQTGSNELVVTLCEIQKVQFCRIDNLLCTRSFTLDQYCRGIRYANDTLFITGEGPESNELRTYTLSGGPLKTFKIDSQGNDLFDCIFHLAFSLDLSRIYVADTGLGMITLDEEGNKLSTVSEEKLVEIFGVSTGDCGELFMCGRHSHNVSQTDRNGTLVKEILTQSDGLSDPVSVTFITDPRRLIVTCENSNTIKVFNLT
ncbi:uncharacterized protein LOC123544745 [Mercenaria mercenaria]|uniref:uncharacterized protein LOC123544745 n=1 Tax=Mercenaria mercenaria TaxID=6596 RepID=UPI00234F0A48|nr:uncharacterized protein LOC123544745 [Mercenaria mercenaria]